MAIRSIKKQNLSPSHQGKKMKFTTVFTAINLIEAEMVKDALIAHSIETRVINKNMATLYPYVDAIGIQVQVLSSDEKKARQILQQLKAA
jgi:hypothetical protein